MDHVQPLNGAPEDCVLVVKPRLEPFVSILLQCEIQVDELTVFSVVMKN